MIMHTSDREQGNQTYRTMGPERETKLEQEEKEEKS